MSQLHEHYKKTVVEELVKSGKYTNRMQVPRVEKVCINMGINSKHDKDVTTAAQAELAAGHFPLVLGGDCGVMLGCLYGARRAGVVRVRDEH